MRKKFSGAWPLRRRPRRMLDEARREKLRTLTVELVLAVRSEYLRAGQCNVLKHWEQLETRLRAAAATSSNPEELATRYARSLQLVGLSKDASRVLTELADYVREQACAIDWLELIDAESAYVMALARLQSEQRKEEREAAKLSRETVESTARSHGLLEE
jgi:hypothetical protein